MIRPGGFLWLARHELRLSWREWAALVNGGKRRRGPIVMLVALLVAVLMHLLARHLIGPNAPSGAEPQQAVLILVTGCALLSWSLTLSQAMETVTRVFYARADLDLVLASPSSARKVFSVRMAAVALSTSMLALLLSAPFINTLAWSGGPRWLGAYAVVLAMGVAASAISLAITVFLFRTIGPKRTRLAAQIIAAIVGAIFVIGVQIMAIVSSNTLSRFAVFQSESIGSLAPGPESAFWWPARAIMGDMPALLGVLAGSIMLFAATVAFFSGRFAEHAMAAAGIGFAPAGGRPPSGPFRPTTPARILRRKEWTLLKRDPWLVSQTLMQILYLLPPALLLWRNYGSDEDTLLVLVPIFVMAAGQLAGGLAWLAVSGEDAPDLVATAPVAAHRILRAKVEAVLGAIAVALSPLLIALAFASPRDALVTAIGILLAAGSATLIQLWFRTQAKRRNFQRRQTSSRIATFAEAFSSISWAAAAGLAAAGMWLALLPGMFAFAILAVVRLIRPQS